MTANEMIIDALNAAYQIRATRLNEKIAVLDEIARNDTDAKIRKSHRQFRQNSYDELNTLNHTYSEAVARLQEAGIIVLPPVEIYTVIVQ